MNFLDRSVAGLAAGETFGIRPEHLSFREDGQITGEVTHVERLGGDTNLLVRTDQSETLTVRLFGQDTTPVGARVRLGFNPADAFRFDAEDQRVQAMAA